MKKAEQVIVCCPDVPGVLNELTTVLWGNRVHIREFTAEVTEGILIIRLIVDKPLLTRSLIHQLGWGSERRRWPSPIEKTYLLYQQELELTSQ